MSSMLKSARNSDSTKGCTADDCSCCNPKSLRRRAKRIVKRREDRVWKNVERTSY